MKCTSQRDNSSATFRRARKFQRALHRLGARVAKENGIEVRWRPFRQRLREQPTQQRAVHLHHVWKVEIEDIADRLLYYRMVASNIENAIAAQEIEIRLIIHVVEVSSLRPHIELVEPDHALLRNHGAVQVPLAQFVILAQTRCSDFL